MRLQSISLLLMMLGTTSCTQTVHQMLFSGDGKACSNDNVHGVVENLLAPQNPPGDSPQDNSAYIQARKTISFAFDTTTLETNDKSTHSMTCSANVIAKIGGNDTGTQKVVYEIQPIAESGQDSSFAVTLLTDSDAAHVAVTSLLNSEVGRIEIAAQNAANAASAAAEAAAVASANAAAAVANSAAANSMESTQPLTGVDQSTNAANTIQLPSQ